MALSVGRTGRHRFPLAPGRHELILEGGYSRLYIAERDLFLLAASLDGATAQLLLPCSLPMCWTWLLASVHSEGAGEEPGAVPLEPGGMWHSSGLGLPALAMPKDGDRQRLSWALSAVLFFSCVDRTVMRAFLPARMHSCTWLSDAGHESPPACSSPLWERAGHPTPSLS